MNLSITDRRGTCMPWQERLAPGDIVLFRFPSSAGRGVVPVARPCLVLEVGTLVGTRQAVLAFGCTARSRRQHGFEVRVTDALEISAAGLLAPTRFLLTQQISVSLDCVDFVARDGSGSPITGRLGLATLERMHLAIARRPENRTAPDGGRVPRSRRTRSFIVERRQRKPWARPTGASA